MRCTLFPLTLLLILGACVLPRSANSGAPLSCHMRCLFHSLTLHLLLLLVACSLPHAAGNEETLTLGTTTDSGGTGTTIPLDDSRYSWLTWSKWSCNCLAGSMSRVRDVKYQVAAVTLSNDDFNRKRFQRVVCDYGECPCDRNLGQCDRAKADCAEREDYQCAIMDVGYAQQQRTKNFWHKTQTPSQSIWDRLKSTFLGSRKEEESLQHQAAGKRNSKAKTKATRKSQQSTSNK